MNRPILPILILLILFVCSSLGAQERVWDQAEAKKRVQAALDLEKQGQPWNNIVWMTSVEAAELRAEDTQKPLFVFAFLKKPVGPKEAPC